MNAHLRVGACLSLSGRFARFGRQAALGLQAWQSLDGDAELVIEDDESDRRLVESLLPEVAARCDVLLGPYSTVLMRAAGRVAAECNYLIWNQGGSGDETEQTRSGYVISILTPAIRYAEPFIQYLAAAERDQDLCVVHGPGRFGRQVADGAAESAERAGIHVVRADPDTFPPAGLSGDWDLFSAGVFEQDAELTGRALRLSDPPRRICTISAGVRDFAQVVDDPEGVFGIAQWTPGSQCEPMLGPTEEAFLGACREYDEQVPDYPAVQAAAGALIAAHCARLVGSSRREDLWAAAAALDTSTLFGGFKINPSTGTQLKHATALVRWGKSGPKAVSAETWRGAA